MKMRACLLAAALAAVFAAVPSNATPIIWTLQDVTFTDGGTAQGHFTYDADTNILSNVSIKTSLTDAFPGGVYKFPDLSLPSIRASDPAFVTMGSGDLTGTPLLALYLFPAAMTDAGGTLHIPPGVPLEGLCNDATCTDGAAYRFSAGGFITSASVPEPATAPVLFAALLGLGLFGLRRTKAD
jgi:MYXO-CTERM domain-containing protein